MEGYIKNKEGLTKNGKSGGLFKGDSHAMPSGGIKIKVDGGSEALVEGNEVIVIPDAVNNPKKHLFNGKQMTAKEILSEINTKYKGVPIKKKGGIVQTKDVVNNEEPILVDSGSVIITKPAILDNITKNNFDGKEMTNTEVLSEINKSGGGVEFARGGGIKTLGHSGKKIEFVDSNPAATYKALTKWLDSKGIKYDYNFARTTSSRYITFTDEDGNEFKIRIATHTPALSDLSEHIGFKADATDSFSIDSSFGYKASDIENIIELIPKTKEELYSNESIKNAMGSFGFIHDFVSSYGSRQMLSIFMAENNISNDKYGVSESLLKAIFSEIRYTTEYKAFKEAKDKQKEDARKLEKKYYTASNGVIVDTKNKNDSFIWDFDYTNVPNTFGSAAKKYREQLRDFARAELKDLVVKGEVKEQGGEINKDGGGVEFKDGGDVSQYIDKSSLEKVIESENAYNLEIALEILEQTDVPYLFQSTKNSEPKELINYIAEQGMGMYSDDKESQYKATVNMFGKELTDASIEAYPIACKYKDGGLLHAIDLSFDNLQKNGLVLKSYDEKSLTVIVYNSGGQERSKGLYKGLYNINLIMDYICHAGNYEVDGQKYRPAAYADLANQIITVLDNPMPRHKSNFDLNKMDEYRKSDHLIIMNQNEVVYDSNKPDKRYKEGGELSINEIETMEIQPNEIADSKLGDMGII